MSLYGIDGSLWTFAGFCRKMGHTLGMYEFFIYHRWCCSKPCRDWEKSSSYTDIFQHHNMVYMYIFYHSGLTGISHSRYHWVDGIGPCHRSIWTNHTPESHPLSQTRKCRRFCSEHRISGESIYDFSRRTIGTIRDNTIYDYGALSRAHRGMVWSRCSTRYGPHLLYYRYYRFSHHALSKIFEIISKLIKSVWVKNSIYECFFMSILLIPSMATKIQTIWSHTEGNAPEK